MKEIEFDSSDIMISGIVILLVAIRVVLLQATLESNIMRISELYLPEKGWFKVVSIPNL